VVGGGEIRGVGMAGGEARAGGSEMASLGVRRQGRRMG